ncbi:TonB-dependent receptor [Sphingobium subterraneum]|uniref:Iron complex outermembrane receptor protein n=1 Tax=Sphingobium subterraneum TaxID=627688 RepID=A0A841J6Y3_9SPHN|nr:TonB-dependent receptor [Sphingobium subterraneum]MBB6125286.1 iron complex outermembrane receptor protein [Sphingobium subterraneum]
MTSAVAIVSPSYAQSVPTDNANAAEERPDEIVVTAQRRETVLSRTAVSATAFSGEQLQNAGIGTLDDLATQTPNFSYVDTGLIPRYRIRGDGLQVFNDTSDSPVGFAVDDIFYGAGALQRVPLYDVQRVEVLRGPQGTLFGRNTTAGLVQVTTNKPGAEFGGYVQGQLGSFWQRQIEGAANIPLAEGIRGRVSFYYDEDDGFQRNVAIPDGKRWSARDVLSGRAQLGFDLGADATMVLKAGFTRDRSVAPSSGSQGALDPVTGDPCSTGRILANECVNGTGFNFGKPSPKKIFSEYDGMPNHLDFAEYSARLNWKLSPSIELVAITGYLDYDRIFSEDADGSAVGGFLGNAAAIYTLDARQFSQEVQLRGGNEGALNWVLGGFYYNDRRTATSTVPEFFGTAIDTTGRVRTEAGALFGNVDLPLGETVGVELGGRYTKETKKLDLVFATAPSADYKVSVDEFTWRAGVNWRPDDALFLYANAATGYKSPDFNTTLLFGDASAAAPTDPETSFSLEAGAKLRLNGGRLLFSVAGFRNKVENKQSTVAQLVNGLPVSRLFNFGDVKLYGAEFELTGKVTDRLTTQLGLSLLDSKISAPATTTFRSGPAAIETPVDGKQLTATPHYKINGLLRYDFAPSSVGSFAVQTDFTYTGHQYFQLDNNDRDAQDAYGIVNFRLFWRNPSDRFSVQAFVENATNTAYASYVVTPGGFDTRYIWWGKPRTWGVRVGMDF